MTEDEKKAQLLLNRAGQYLNHFLHREVNELKNQGIEVSEASSLKGLTQLLTDIRDFLKVGHL